MPPDSAALWVTAASMTSTPARAKTSPRAIVPVMPDSSTTRRIRALSWAVCRYFMGFSPGALDDQDGAAGDDDQPGDADQHPRPAGAAWPWPLCPAAGPDWLRDVPLITVNVR